MNPKPVNFSAELGPCIQCSLDTAPIVLSAPVFNQRLRFHERHALRRYVQQRDRHPESSRTDAFFVFDYGRGASTRRVQYAFSLLRGSLKWRSRGGLPKPRIQDLRHSFVCHRLERWYAQGLDINRKILALSTYVGHAKITDTYWYVTATPELLARAAERFTSRRGGVR